MFLATSDVARHFIGPQGPTDVARHVIDSQFVPLFSSWMATCDVASKGLAVVARSVIDTRFEPSFLNYMTPMTLRATSCVQNACR